MWDRSSQKNGCPSLELVVTARAKRDEISQVIGFATFGYGLSVVYLEPLAARAAGGTAAAVAGERGRAGPLPFRGGPDEHARFTGGATLSGSVALAPAARATLALVRRVERGPAPGAQAEDPHPRTRLSSSARRTRLARIASLAGIERVWWAMTARYGPLRPSPALPGSTRPARLVAPRWRGA